MELVFNIVQENDGGYVAECLSRDIFTQGNSWEELRSNVLEAVAAYFSDQERPKRSAFTWFTMKSWPAHETASRYEG